MRGFRNTWLICCNSHHLAIVPSAGRGLGHPIPPAVMSIPGSAFCCGPWASLGGCLAPTPPCRTGWRDTAGAFHPRRREPSAPRPGISLPLLVPAVPPCLGSCPGREAEALQGRPPRLLGQGARALSPRQGFGDGIWVIPDGISLV